MVAAFAGRTRVGDLIVGRKQIGAPNKFAQMSDGFCVTSSSRGSAYILTQTWPSCATQIKLVSRAAFPRCGAGGTCHFRTELSTTKSAHRSQDRFSPVGYCKRVAAAGSP